MINSSNIDINKISIIIPIYNATEFLERCLKSVQDQTYKNIEVLMINDGSSDESETICKAFEQNDTRFRYIYQNNSGVSTARNNGLRNKRGDFYTFIDADDWVEPDYCEKMISKMNEEELDIVFCGVNYWSNGIKSPQKEEGMLDAIVNRRVEHFLIGHPQHVLGSIWRVLYRSKKFETVGFNENLHIYEDLIYLLTCISMTVKMTYIKDGLYNYELPQVGYFKKYYRENIFDICYCVGEKLSSILLELGYEDWANAELFKEYCLAVNWICDVECDKIQQFKKLKRHALAKEYCKREYYSAYIKLYQPKSFTNKFTLWLQKNKYNITLYRFKQLKRKIS